MSSPGDQLGNGRARFKDKSLASVPLGTPGGELELAAGAALGHVSKQNELITQNNVGNI